MSFRHPRFTRFALAASLAAGLTLPAFADAKAASNIASFEPTSLVKNDGTFWLWGGQRTSPTWIYGPERIAAAYTDQAYNRFGDQRPFLEDEDGYIYYMALTPNSYDYATYPIPALRHLAGVFQTPDRYYFVEADGDVFELEYSYETPVEKTLDRVRPVSGISEAAKIDSYSVRGEDGYRQATLFLKKDGTLWQSFPQGAEPAAIPLEGVVDLRENVALTSDGDVWRLPSEAADGALMPQRVEGVSNVASFDTNDLTTVAVDRDGGVWFWGSSVTGFSDGTTFHDHPLPVRLENAEGGAKATIVDRRHLLVLTESGELHHASLDGETIGADLAFERLASDVAELKASPGHVIFRKSDDTMWGWAPGGGAQLGNGDDAFAEGPTPMQRPIAVYVNGERVSLPNGVIVRGGQSFLPLRSVFGQLGADVGWDHPTQMVTIERDDPTKPKLMISIDYGTGELTQNGEPVALANEPFILNGSAYLPLRFVSESLGAKVDWDDAAETIQITME
ncbi:copper amine oxidase N-terminal domain-containing protein [Paenibacillus sp. TRM 82003]|nr:copper amine oxidase N-terminal domain-containing protein [Paenibacillus sp. TRM 82003]